MTVAGIQYFRRHALEKAYMESLAHLEPALVPSPETRLLVLEALTPAESNACRSVDDLVDVLDAVDSPRLAAMCDVVPPVLQHEPITGYLDRLGDRLAHLHVVDSDGGTVTTGELMICDTGVSLEERPSSTTLRA